MKKLVALGLLAVLVLFILWVDLPEALDLQNLQAQRTRLAGLIAQAPLLSAAIYFGLYVLIAAFSIPGAAVMTMAGGALFGFGTGLLLASFASTIGASLAFLGTRYLMREAMAARFSARMRQIDEGIARDGPLYLFSLRLIPILPFLLVNILMGLTKMRVLTFAVVSQIGMFPATALYVNAGTQLADLTSVSDVLSLPIVLSFVALGLLPWIARGVMAG